MFKQVTKSWLDAELKENTWKEETNIYIFFKPM